MKKTPPTTQNGDEANEMAPNAAPEDDQEEFAGLWLFGLLGDIFDESLQGEKTQRDSNHTPIA